MLSLNHHLSLYTKLITVLKGGGGGVRPVFGCDFKESTIRQKL